MKTFTIDEIILDLDKRIATTKSLLKEKEIKDIAEQWYFGYIKALENLRTYYDIS